MDFFYNFIIVLNIEYPLYLKVALSIFKYTDLKNVIVQLYCIFLII